MIARTIRGAEKKAAKERRKGYDAKERLSVRMDRVRERCPDLAGKSDEELFIEACGDTEQGKADFKEARERGGEHETMDAFCNSRLATTSEREQGATTNAPGDTAPAAQFGDTGLLLKLKKKFKRKGE